MMAEQQRLLTVSGGLESLSVWDDSETDRRFLRLQTTRTETSDPHFTLRNYRTLTEAGID